MECCRFIDLSHDFIKQVMSHPRKVLCVIVGVAVPVNDCKLSASTQASGEETLEVDKVSVLSRIFMSIRVVQAIVHIVFIH